MVDFTINDGLDHPKNGISVDFTIQTGDGQEQLTDKEEVRYRNVEALESLGLFGILLMDSYSKWNPYRII